MIRGPSIDPLTDAFNRMRSNQAENLSIRRLVPEIALGADRRDLFRKIFEHSNDAIVIIDPANDRIIDANPKASDMLGYPGVELPGMAISAVHPSEMPRLLAFTDRVLIDGSGWTDELTRLKKNGVRLPSEISASSTTIGGKPCVIAIVRDVRERKEAEQALRAAQAETRALDQHARREAEQALLHLKRQHELILNAAGDGIYGIDTTLTVSGDEDKLKQVLINLLTNACQATLPNETITIDVVEPQGREVIVFEVVNPGTIATNIRDRITEPFFTTKPHGSGLGLAIVKRIVEAHGGELSIRSDNNSRVVASVSLPAMRNS